jgi:MarR family transcriptional regulator, organic hydroperoxide resistance regulator
MSGELELRRQVCFALYAASRAATGFYRPALERIGLTYPQYLVMLVLWEHQERSVKDIGTALMLDSGTLSPVLKRLEGAGLVTRRRDEHDERSVLVALTPRGDRLRAEAAAVPTAIAGATGLSVDELASLRDTLVTLTERLTAAPSEPVRR